LSGPLQIVFNQPKTVPLRSRSDETVSLLAKVFDLRMYWSRRPASRRCKATGRAQEADRLSAFRGGLTEIRTTQVGSATLRRGGADRYNQHDHS